MPRISQSIENLENFIYKGNKANISANDTSDEKSRCVYDLLYGYC